jgi:Cu/Ag efflux protein CusF
MKKILGVVFCLFFLAGCGGYWQVVDPTTKNTYYTEEVKESKSTGAVKFIDAKTGKEVTLQNSEVKEISKEEFQAGAGKK